MSLEEEKAMCLEEKKAMCFAEDKMMHLAEEIVALLKKNDLKLTTAESCTGGMIASTLINVPGISDYYEEGYITYANKAKVKLLSVDEKVLCEKGAVSPKVAEMMVRGAAKASGADVAIAVTGIAGPGGGTKEKPVGLVYIGCYLKGQAVVTENHFVGSRLEIRQKTTETALQMMRDCLAEYLEK